MADTPERFRLPETLSSAGDPVVGNPFPEEHPLHERWINATRKAEEEVCRVGSRSMSSLTPDNAEDWFPNLIVAKFDVWAERGVNVVWSDGIMRDYDRWLLSYANAWIDEVWRHYERVPPPFPIEAELLELRNRLGARVQHWKAEARRYRAEQVAEAERRDSATEPVSASGCRTKAITGWPDVEVCFLSDHRVQITTKHGSSETLNYAELGFEDARSRTPKKAWATLQALAESGGELATTPKTLSKVERRIQEVRQVLRRRFGIDEDPLPFIKTGYKAKFRIHCSPSYDT